MGAARLFFPVADEHIKVGVVSLIGVFTRPVLRAGDWRATLWKASKYSVTMGLLEKFSISVTLFDSMSVERRESCDLSSNNIGLLRRCLAPSVPGRVSDRLRWWWVSEVSFAGTENGLGETGNGELTEPNIVLAVGRGSGVVGDGGAFGLGPGEGHKMAGVDEESESIKRSSPSRLFDSSYGSTTVGSDDGGGYKSSSYSSSVTLISMTNSYLLP